MGLLADRQHRANVALRTKNAPGDILALQAAGIDTRQIPGLFGALSEGGQAVRQGLLANPQAPLQGGGRALQRAGIESVAVAAATAREKLASDIIGTDQARLDFQVSEAEAREKFGQDALNARLAEQQKKAEDLQRQFAGLPIAGPNQRIIFNPYSRQDQLVPLAGTSAYQAEQGKIDAQQQLMTEIQRMKDLIELAGPTGTDFTGENAARMQRQQAAISLAFKNAEDLGALQEADIALVKAGMIDPTSISENLEAIVRSSVGGMLGFFSSGQKPVILAGYDQAMERIFDQMETQFKNHPYLRLDETRINPEFRDRLVPTP